MAENESIHIWYLVELSRAIQTLLSPSSALQLLSYNTIAKRRALGACGDVEQIRLALGRPGHELLGPN
jgi:hypothetical protein